MFLAMDSIWFDKGTDDELTVGVVFSCCGSIFSDGGESFREGRRIIHIISDS